MALHDQLTGLANRQMLSSRLEESMRSTELSGRPMSVVFLDLDGFKPINDRLGHMRRPLSGVRDDLRVTASIGVACFAGGRRAGADGLLDAADQAMYQSKTKGSDTTTVVEA